MPQNFGNVTIVGVGLIGGSIGQALRTRSLANRVVGVGRNPERLQQGVELGAIDAFATDERAAFANADVVVVCSPVSSVADFVRSAAEHSHDDALITDAGSTKRLIVDRIHDHQAARRKFVPAHPIAGSEKSGVEHSRADLFEGATCVLTPTEETPDRAQTRIAAFWEALGCRIARMSPETHDVVLARVSHGPHVLAAALARTTPASAQAFAGGAFRDITRVAAADSELWTSIFLENRRAVLAALDAYVDDITEFRHLLESSDREGLQSWWREARDSRRTFEVGRATASHHQGGD